MSTATQVQLRRGTDAQVAAFTGAAGEVTPAMTSFALVLHDGSTVGGHRQATEAYVQAQLASALSAPIITFSQWLFCT